MEVAEGRTPFNVPHFTKLVKVPLAHPLIETPGMVLGMFTHGQPLSVFPRGGRRAYEGVLLHQPIHMQGVVTR